jgi:hypothetical protein
MRLGMNQAEVDAFVARLKAGADLQELEAASDVDPAWFEVNRGALLKLAGIEPAGEPEAEEPPDAPAVTPARRVRKAKTAE